MAESKARKHKIRHDDETRAKIQAAQLINRFMAHFMGEVELSPAQVTSGKTLLNKVLPDLSAVSLEGNSDKPIVTAVEWRVVDNKS